MVDNQDINIFFASNLPYDVTENSLKDFFSPHLDLTFTNLKRTKYGVKSSYGYLHFRNKKEDVISFIENNIYQNHKIWIDIFQGGVCEQEDVENGERNEENIKKGEETGENIKNGEENEENIKNVGKNVGENYNGSPDIWRNIPFDKKIIELINKNGDITKYGESIIENMNMYDIILIINKLQELIRACPQTAIHMLNGNKKIYYAFIHTLFLLGILNIDANKLNDEELILSNFYKIKNKLQYLFLNKKENNEINNIVEEDITFEKQINKNCNKQNKLYNYDEENYPNALYNLIKKKRNDDYRKQSEYGLYLNDKKKIKTGKSRKEEAIEEAREGAREEAREETGNKISEKANALNKNQEYENDYSEVNGLIPNSYGNVLYSFISTTSNKINTNENGYVENKIQYNKTDTNKSGLYGKGLYGSNNKNKNKNKKVENDINSGQPYYNIDVENDESANVGNISRGNVGNTSSGNVGNTSSGNVEKNRSNNVEKNRSNNVEKNRSNNVESTNVESNSVGSNSGHGGDASNFSSNKNDSRIKSFDFGKNLIKKINTSNNQRRGIKLIDRTSNGDNVEENVIKIKNVYNIQEDINKKDKNQKKNIENNINLKKVLEKINLTINEIPEAEEQLIKEVINQKDILQNILASKYTDMLKWNNEQTLRVLSLRKSLKKKGYKITGPI